MLTSVNHLSLCERLRIKRAPRPELYVIRVHVPSSPPLYLLPLLNICPCQSFEKYKDCFDNNYTEGSVEPNLVWS